MRENFDGIIASVNIGEGNWRFAVKDLFAIAGRTAGFGNPDWLRTHQPELEHAEAVRLLLAAQAHLVAITCTDEMAFSLDGINIHYGTPLNSQLPDCIPGGSSSGSASVVAAKLVDFALGTDTAGSIRVPASYCGIWGLRTTHGAISTKGILPLGPSFDTVGILASERLQLRKAAEVLLPELKKESQNNQHAQQNLIIADDLMALTEPQLAPPLVAAIKRCDHFKIKHINIADYLDLKELLQAFNAIRGYEAWQCHGQWLEEVNPALAAPIKERFLACQGATVDEAQLARKIQKEVKSRLHDLLDGNLLCLPTTATLPPVKHSSPAQLQSNRVANMTLCCIASLAGLPQISMPIALTNGAGKGPIVKTGLSLLAAPGSDLSIINAAAAFE